MQGMEEQIYEAEDPLEDWQDQQLYNQQSSRWKPNFWAIAIIVCQITSIGINIYYFKDFQTHIATFGSQLKSLDEIGTNVSSLDGELTNMLNYLCATYNICV